MAWGELQSKLEQNLMSAGGDVPSFLRVVVSTGLGFALENRNMVRYLMRHVVDTGRATLPGREGFLQALVQQGAQMLAAVAERPLHETRMALLSTNHLIIRYAVNGLDDVLDLGIDDEPTASITERRAAAQAILEEHLTQLLLSYLRLT